VQRAVLFEAGDDLINFFSLCSHLVELFFENVQQEENQLDLIFDLLHLLGLNLEVDLLQEVCYLLPELFHLLASPEMQLQFQLFDLHIDL
jgi:hypothetical protein